MISRLSVLPQSIVVQWKINILHVLKITCEWLLLNKGSCLWSTKPNSDSWYLQSKRFLHGVLTGRSNSSCLKISNSSMAFSQGFLKTVLEERAAGCMISLWTFWLVGGKATQWCFGNLSILVPTILKAMCLSSAYSHHPPPSWELVWIFWDSS